MKRFIFLFYGIFCYLIFLGTFSYAIGFVGNFWVPKTMDAGSTISLTQALLIDILLVSIFAVQHSVMARTWFKQWWTQIIPKSIERSTYVLFASLALMLLFWQWQPIDLMIWNVSNSIWGNVLMGISLLGWLIVLVSTFLISHFDLFGLRQVYCYFTKQEYSRLPFSKPALYKIVRHPIYLGFILAFWGTSVMSMAHFVFAIAMTVYIVLAIQFEEQDLLNFYGEMYRNYREKVSMLIPLPPKKE